MKSAAWAALEKHFATIEERHLRDLFAADPERAERLTVEAAGLFLDYSKNRVTDETLALLLDLAAEAGVAERRDAMFAGERINVTEDRSVLHVALRMPRGSSLVVDGVDVVAEVHAVLDRMAAFSDAVRSGEWRGFTGAPIRNVVNIGIGGSDLGPVMAYRALRHYSRRDLTFRFVSNIDGTDFVEATRDLDPAETLFVVCSKTFTTLETMTNAANGAAVAARRARRRRGAIARHFVAVSTNLEGGLGVRHRPGERVRLLGLGRRAVLDGLGDRALDDARDRARGLRTAARRLPRDGRALPHGPTRREHAGADGAARCLVLGLLRLPDRRGAPVRPVPRAVPGLPAAADDGVEREEHAHRLVTRRRRHGADLLGRAGHERPAQLLPADPPGHAADPVRLHLLRGRASTRSGTTTTCSSRTCSRRPRRSRSGRRPRRSRRRAIQRGSSRTGRSRATGRRTCSWRSGSRPRCSARSWRCTSTASSCRA